MFDRRPEFHAVRQSAGTPLQTAVALLTEDAHTVYGIYEGPPTSGEGNELLPVYSVGPHGALAVPTGRVFVRLSDGLRATDRSDDFSAAGFSVEQSPSYAPNAAWLRPREGGVATALAGIEKLHGIAGVVHVEPQMLSERSLRSR